MASQPQPATGYGYRLIDSRFLISFHLHFHALFHFQIFISLIVSFRWLFHAIFLHIACQAFIAIIFH